MYLPNHFKEERPEVLIPFIQEYPFGLLITIEEDIAQGNHLPWILVNNSLQAHIPKVNPLYAFLKDREHLEVLIVFQGPQAYITPSWYPSKKETGKVVPTWNYSVVHVRGKLRLQDNEKWLIEHLNQLTHVQEKTRDSDWQMSDAPHEYTQSMMRVLVGLDVEIDSMQGKFKLSQNRLEKDRLGVIQHLAESLDKQEVKLAKLSEQFYQK
jgi:transcriptional regulator